MSQSEETKPATILRSEAAFLTGVVTTLLFFSFGSAWLGDLSMSMMTVGLFIWLFAVMLWLSFGVVRHADCLAVILGEPYGTLILTLSVISIEVIMIAAVMLHGENNPTMARYHVLRANDRAQRHAWRDPTDWWAAPP